MKKLTFAILGALALSTVAMAGDPPLPSGSPGTCSNPIPITSNDSVSADTCAYGNELTDMGGTPSAPNDVIYSYVSNSANANVTVTGPANSVVYLLPSCQTSTDPIAFGFGGTPMVVDSSNSPDGSTIYFNVTFDGTAGADLCGTVQLDVAGTLPVELKNFSID